MAGMMSGAVDGSYVDALERAASGSGVEPEMRFGLATDGEPSLAGRDPFTTVEHGGHIERPQGTQPAAAAPQNGNAGADYAAREAALIEREARLMRAMEQVTSGAMRIAQPGTQPEAAAPQEAPKGPVYKSLESSMTAEEWADLDAATRLRIRELDSTHRSNFEAIAQAQGKVDLSPVEQRLAAMEKQIEQDRSARQMADWTRQAEQAEQVFGAMLTPQHRTSVANYAMQHNTDIGTAIRVVAPDVWEAKIREQAVRDYQRQVHSQNAAAAIWPGGVGAAPKNLDYEDGESFGMSAAKVATRARGGQGGPGL